MITLSVAVIAVNKYVRLVKKYFFSCLKVKIELISISGDGKC